MTTEHPVGPEEEVLQGTPRGERSGPGTAPRLQTNCATRAGSWKADPFGHGATAGYPGAYRAELHWYLDAMLGMGARIHRGTIERRRVGCRRGLPSPRGLPWGVTLAHGGSR